MTFLLSFWFSQTVNQGAKSLLLSQGVFALCFGLFCSALPCPAMPVSSIFSHCYHFSPLSGSDISFRDLQLVLLVASSFALAFYYTGSFFAFYFQLFWCVFIVSFLCWFLCLSWLSEWVLLDLAQWTRWWSCWLTGWASHSSAAGVEVNSRITVPSRAITMALKP